MQGVHKRALQVALVLLILAVFSLQDKVLDRLQKKALDAGTNLIQVKDMTEFQRLWKAKSEAYIVIFFTVGPDRIAQCPYCTVFKKIVATIAQKEVPKNGERSTEVYFAFIEFGESVQEAAQFLQARHVPALFLLSPNSNEAVSCDLSKQQIPDFLQEHTGYDIQMDESEVRDILGSSAVEDQGQGQGRQEQPKVNVVAFAWKSSAVLLVIIGIFFFIQFLTKLRNRTNLLAFICFILLEISLGGTVYNMINDPPAFHYNPYSRQITYFYPEMRGQLQVEGYLAALVILVAAASFTALTEHVPYVKESNKRVYSLLLMILFSGSFFTLVVFFLFKSPGYLFDTPFAPYMHLLQQLFSQ